MVNRLFGNYFGDHYFGDRWVSNLMDLIAPQWSCHRPIAMLICMPTHFCLQIMMWKLIYYINVLVVHLTLR